MHHIEIHLLGPVEFCELDIDQFIVLTGPQASGKSTIAKAVFYFRTVKDDILDMMLKPAAKEDDTHKNKWEISVKKRLRDKFLRLFGTSWSMPNDMELRYTYSDRIWIRLYLKENYQEEYRNFVDFEFSEDLQDYFYDLDQRILSEVSPEMKERNQKKLETMFCDPFETVLIPAGRSMITLLTDQLNYIFTSMDETMRRTLDYGIQNYIERILKLKPVFDKGLDGLLSDKLHLTQDKVDRRICKKALALIDKILKGHYVYSKGEEKLMISRENYVKINFASSGQQESVWILNILFYYLVNNRRIFLIVEEPESHLYPDSQKYIAELLGLFVHAGNTALVTTHSPYILGEFNNLLYACEIPESAREEAQKIIDRDELLPYSATRAFHVLNGRIEEGLEARPGLIRNELIDGVSEEINNENDALMELKWKSEGKE